MAITIIALIISLLSLGFGLSVLRENRKASREIDGIIKELKSQKPEKPLVQISGMDIMYYDEKREAVVVKGNLEAEGYIAAGIKEE